MYDELRSLDSHQRPREASMHTAGVQLEGVRRPPASRRSPRGQDWRYNGAVTIKSGSLEMPPQACRS